MYYTSSFFSFCEKKYLWQLIFCLSISFILNHHFGERVSLNPWFQECYCCWGIYSWQWQCNTNPRLLEEPYWNYQPSCFILWDRNLFSVSYKRSLVYHLHHVSNSSYRLPSCRLLEYWLPWSCFYHFKKHLTNGILICGCQYPINPYYTKFSEDFMMWYIIQTCHSTCFSLWQLMENEGNVVHMPSGWVEVMY